MLYCAHSVVGPADTSEHTHKHSDMPENNFVEKCTVKTVIVFFGFMGMTNMYINSEPQSDLMSVFPYIHNRFIDHLNPSFTIEILCSLYFNITLYFILIRIWIFGGMVWRTFFVFQAFMGCVLQMVNAVFNLWSFDQLMDLMPPGTADEAVLFNRMKFLSVIGVLVHIECAVNSWIPTSAPSCHSYFLFAITRSLYVLYYYF